MLLDQQAVYAGSEVFVFPDWLFGDVPKQPADMKQLEVLMGGSAFTSLSVTGTSDGNVNLEP